jgi:hypothetical protein
LGKGKGNKTGGRDFKRGNPGGGRPLLPTEIKEARKLNKYDVEMSLTNHLRMNREQIATVIKNPESNMLDILVASIIAKAVQTGDQQRLDFILNRTIGKVVDTIEVADNRVSIALAYNPKERILGHGTTKEISSRTIDVDARDSCEGPGESMASPLQVGRKADAEE